MERAVQRYAVEIRSEMAGDTLRGYASVFDRVAKVKGGYEQVARSAFDDVLANQKRPDPVALINHNESLLLGRRSSKTLRLGTDSRGLHFEVDLPNTSYAHDLRELVARGDMTGGSFGFVPGKDEIDRAPDGLQIRSHTSLAVLADVSVVTHPAYEDAAVELRSLDWSTVRPRLTAREQHLRARMARLMKG